LLLEFAIDDKKILSVFDVLHGERIEITFAVGELVNCIEHIGFPNTVLAYKQLIFSLKSKLAWKIFVIEKEIFLRYIENLVLEIGCKLSKNSRYEVLLFS
jgi:hypothetical protein